MVLFDDSLWPLVSVKFVGTPSEEQFDGYLAKMTEYLNRGEKYVILYDSTQMEAPSMDHRQRQVDWLQRNETLVRERILGTAFIITSPLLRLAMNVVQFLGKPPHPTHVAANQPAAVEWAEARFREAGLTLVSVRIRAHFGLLRNQATK